MTWDCSQNINGYCKRLKRDCKPGIRGCILEQRICRSKELEKQHLEKLHQKKDGKTQEQSPR